MWAFTEQTTETTDGSLGVDAADAAGEALLHGFGNSPDAPRLLLFTAAGQTCACELDGVREIIPCCRATRLPGAPSYVTGLINLRGSIITVLDLGLRLGGSRVDPERGSIILAQHGSGMVGLAVDDLRDVQRVHREAIEAPDSGSTRDGLVCGVLRAGPDVAILLDLGRIVALTLL
jgi:purine-binding chemotaxis protein CheW